MCHLFAHQAQRDYESQTRSLRMGGHSTSIRLEMAFWDTLEEIAAKEGMSLAKFVTTLYAEVLDHHGEVKNFASLRSEEHTSELQSQFHLVCRLLLEKKKIQNYKKY